MATHDNQLRPADEKAGDNNGRNIVKPQTQEPYGDQELAAESKVHFEHHFAGQPLETKADRDANEALRAERRERAKVDPIFRHQQKIELPEDEIEVHMSDVLVPLIGDPNDLPVDGEDNDADNADEHDAYAGNSDDPDAALKQRLVDLGLREKDDQSDLDQDEIELAQLSDDELQANQGRDNDHADEN